MVLDIKELKNLMNIIKTKNINIYKDISLIPELLSDFPKCYSNYLLKFQKEMKDIY